jgi:hypothetical protein
LIEEIKTKGLPSFNSEENMWVQRITFIFDNNLMEVDLFLTEKGDDFEFSSIYNANAFNTNVINNIKSDGNILNLLVSSHSFNGILERIKDKLQ